LGYPAACRAPEMQSKNDSGSGSKPLSFLREHAQ
jgi:hypothetical protein